MKTIRINNGNVYLYNSPTIVFEEKYVSSYVINELILDNYEGRLGLNNSALAISGNTEVRGFLRYPAYIATKGLVDLTVPPNINLSIRSSQNGGTVDGVALDEGTPNYKYGKALFEYALEYFKDELLKKDLDIKSASGKFYLDGEYNKSISYLDLCKWSNLIYINALVSEERYSPRIQIRHSIEEMANSNFDELISLMHSFESLQEFENAASVRDELNSRIKNMK